LTQDVTVEAINTWSSLRVFLIVTNQTTSETSETDPLLAPDSAFVTVRVKSEHAGIEKLAPGARNYDQDTWADKIEEFAGGGGAVHDHEIVDHTDVANATGADLEALTSGGYADDPDAVAPNAGGMLHKHKGTDVDVATTLVRGGVQIESAHTAIAINIERLTWTARCDGTRKHDGWVHYTCTPQLAGEPAPPGVPSHVDFVNREGGSVYVKEIHLALASGGIAAPAAPGLDQYRFLVKTGTQAQWLLNQQPTTLADLTGVPAANNAPMLLSGIGLNIEVLKQQVVSVFCIASPHKAANFANLGHGLSVTILLHRKAQ
jgi:hypothetical protein